MLEKSHTRDLKITLWTGETMVERDSVDIASRILGESHFPLYS